MKKKSHLYAGPVPAAKIGKMVADHQVKTDIGGHAIFLGQVRADEIDGKKVVAIEYSAYEEMAEKELAAIREEAFGKFPMRCLHIHHSIGRVNAGEISLAVMTSSAHRDAAFESCRWITEEIKKRVPVWKKEILEDGSEVWVEGTGTGKEK